MRADGRAVTEELVAAARDAGATDVEIHDTVLIAAAFCMFNRYVDGLATFAPTDPGRLCGVGPPDRRDGIRRPAARLRRYVCGRASEPFRSPRIPAVLDA